MTLGAGKAIALTLTLIGILAIRSGTARALDPALDAGQYAHTAWRIGDGLFSSSVDAMAQTQDGYLWLGTESGLVRFDGIKGARWQPPSGASLPSDVIRALLAARDGRLWIGTSRGLAIWDGKTLVRNGRLDGMTVHEILEDREGTVWLAGSLLDSTFVCTVKGETIACEDGDLDARGWMAVHEARNGSIWVGTARGVERRYPGTPASYPLSDLIRGLQPLSETSSGTLLVVTERGISQLVNGAFEPFPMPALPPSFRPNTLFDDRDGGLWIGGSDGGLLHFHQGRLDALTRADGLSGDSIYRFFEDYEGNVWAATNEGLDRFHGLAAPKYGAAQGISGYVYAILGGLDGSLWISAATGLYRLSDGRLSHYRASRPNAPGVPSGQPRRAFDMQALAVEGLPPAAASLFQDKRGRLWVGSTDGVGYLENGRFVAVSGVPPGYIDAIGEDSDGQIWLLHRDLGPLRLSSDLRVTRVAGMSDADLYLRLAADPVGGGLWLGSWRGGIVHVVDGEIRARYSAADGLGQGAIYHLRVASDGTLWAATAGGLRRLRAGRIATLDSSSGLPCDAIDSSIDDDQGNLWLYAACGLVRIARSEIESWADAMDSGKTARGIQTTLFDSSDGVRIGIVPLGTFSQHVVRDREGRLWFLRIDGVSMVDPHHLPFNALPPPVHVERIVADRASYAVSDQLALPPLLRDLEIDYAALSLVAPEKVRFRYRLEGRDRDWMDAGDRRQAFYNDLAPGNYRFRVIASNNSGVWNEEGASLAFSIAPAYWQTGWFVALCSAACIAALALLYHWRQRQRARTAATEQRYRDMRLELAHANRLSTIGQLTASIAHEINQPLAAAMIQANAAMRWLAAQPPNLDRAKQTLSEIVSANSRAADIVKGIRALVKKAPAQEGVVDVNSEIKGVVAMTATEALKHAVSLRTELAANVPFVLGDRVQLQQLLLNLIVNAIEAMSTMAEGQRELIVRSERDGDSTALSVCDTGPGLDPAIMSTVFEPFHTTKATGLGLGLSICRSIVEAHGGRLWVTANEPRGAIFHIALPGKPAAQLEEAG